MSETGALLKKSKLEVSPINGKYPDDVWLRVWKRRRGIGRHQFGKEEGLRFVRLLENVASGERWKVALKEAGLTYLEASAKYFVKSKATKILVFAAGKLCQASRKLHIEEEAYRRAVDGYDEPVYTQAGKLAGHKKKYSDSVLMMLLRASDPEKYREVAAGAVAGGIVLQVNLGLRPKNPEPDGEVIDTTAEEVPE